MINPQLGPVIAKQLNMIQKQPIDGTIFILNFFFFYFQNKGVHIIFNELDIFDIQADIEGPVDTPFHGGLFRVKLILQAQFPNTAPKGNDLNIIFFPISGLFMTKIFHPNVSEKGEICVNTLKKDWNPQNWSFRNIFEVVKCLLIVPFPESSLNEEAGKLFMENYDEYFKHAKLITNIYAKQEKNILQDQVLKQFKYFFYKLKNPEQFNKKQNVKKENDQKKWLKRI